MLLNWGGLLMTASHIEFGNSYLFVQTDICLYNLRTVLVKQIETNGTTHICVAMHLVCAVESVEGKEDTMHLLEFISVFTYHQNSRYARTILRESAWSRAVVRRDHNDNNLEK